MSLRAAARAVFDAALAAAEVRPLVLQALRGRPWPGAGRVLVVGAGKASGAMAAAVEEALGDRVRAGAVAVKDRHLGPTRRVRLLEAGHPVPDERGVQAAEAVRALAACAAANDLVLVLISGGGSALLPAPAPPVTLSDKQDLTRLLLAAGADIRQLNVVRKHCSRIKGGQLARAASAAGRVTGLVLSDVIGDPLDVIASGPTVPDPSTFEEALAVLERFDLRARTPRQVLDRLEEGARGRIAETPKPGDAVFDRVENLVIGNNARVVDAAARRARSLGLAPHVLTTALEGEARRAAIGFAALARDIRAGRGPVPAPACVIAGGETTVTVTGDGQGGRCQEFALACALEMDGMEGVVALAAGTDGTDGPTDAAGAVADGDTVRRARDHGLDPAERLRANDSHPLFRALGDLVITGPTNTNLLDVYLLLVGV